jgi:hypothetical protein
MYQTFGLFVTPLLYFVDGTLLVNAIFRLFGVKIGSRVFMLNVLWAPDPDLINIGAWQGVAID